MGNETTDHHELTIDEGVTTERVVTQELATDPTTKAKNDKAEANLTLVTKLKTQKNLPKKQPQRPSPTTTSKTKTQPLKKTLKTPNQKNQSKFSSLSKSTWPLLPLHLLTTNQKPPEKLTTARTF